MHSAVCRQRQCNKIFWVYWHKSPPKHLWSFALKSLKTFCFELLLWKKKRERERKDTQKKFRRELPIPEICDKPFLQPLNWAENNRKGDLNSSQPFQHTARTEKPISGTKHSLLKGSFWLFGNLADPGFVQNILSLSLLRWMWYRRVFFGELKLNILETELLYPLRDTVVAVEN